MADIRTRQVNKGNVKTIDRAANLTSRLRSAEVRTKDQVASPTEKGGRNESQYANDNMTQMGKDVAYETGRGIRRGGENARSALRSRRENVDVKTKAEMIRKNRGATATEGVGRSRVVAGAKAKHAGARKTAEAGSSARRSASATEAGKRMMQARKLERSRRAQFAARKTAEKTAKGARRTARLLIRSLRRTIMASKTLIAAIAAGGSAVVAIILICVLLCSALFFFGDENSDDYYTATGDATITQVAAAQVGNHGGRKFWKWYGYNERVDWCAIFVSWCAHQCGYIESGVIPKFAGVPAGVDWFVERGQFRPNTYIPKPGDIIFIDWGGDGTRDHVGIVERCDGRAVYTIEGNSGDACRRQVYSIGSKTIFGYGVPKYTDKQKETTKQTVVK